jgi:hypothetical protein
MDSNVADNACFLSAKFLDRKNGGNLMNMKGVLIRSFLAVMAAGLLMGLQTTPVQAVSMDLVISQVYGGGGNVGATYTNDFIEIFNLGTTPVSLAGLSLQYASATGTGLFGAASNLITELPLFILQPGQYFLIQEAQGLSGTTALPTPDYIDPTPITMSATGAKVALVDTTVSLGCNGGSTPCSPSALATIIDLVGWGSANFFEGAAAPATSNTLALFRNDGGLTDTDNNAADFFTGSPTPRNTASPLNPPSIPEPSTLLLLGAGLAGVGLMRRKLRK